jgi:hypothetical protein
MVLPNSHRASRTPCYSGARTERYPGFRVRGCHALWPPFRRVVPLPLGFLAFRAGLSPPNAESHDPWQATPTGLALARFRLFPLRSPLLRESLMLSLPPGTEMVHFPGFARAPYEFSRTSHPLLGAGFPHSEIDGSQDVCSSPSLIAAYHVLLRLHAPRHPPCALSSLPFQFTLFSKPSEHGSKPIPKLRDRK